MQNHFQGDGISGATTKRPALLRCLKKLEHGDTLIVWKLDRLGRSLRDLITMLDDLKDRGVKFHSLTEAIDTTTPTGRAMWQPQCSLSRSSSPLKHWKLTSKR
jgi:DNA invertase Pin-like site-specific DNA recombinase